MDTDTMSRAGARSPRPGTLPPDLTPNSPGANLPMLLWYAYDG